MDCSHVKLLMAADLSRDATTEERETLLVHLRSCPECNTEVEAFARTWEALATLPDAELPENVWGRIQAHLPEPEPIRRSNAWPATAGAAALGLFASVLASWLLPFERAARICAEGLRGVFDAALPDPVVFFGVGFLYGLLPLGLAAAALAPRLSRGRGHPGLAVGAAFSVLAIPYAVIACGGLPAVFIAALLAGIVAGALAGGPGGVWAGSKLRMPVHT